MLNQLLITLYHRDLNKLKEELNAYGDEAKIWSVQDGISNSAGNLTLHLIGNLNHFIGATLGDTGYVRERDKEFALKNIPRHELLRSIDNTIEMIQKTLDGLTEADLDKDFPISVTPGDKSTRFFLLHLVAHLNYHLGQINYHRRLIAK
jgi:uncharacterized damage-inducible protein DinB